MKKIFISSVYLALQLCSTLNQRKFAEDIHPSEEKQVHDNPLDGCQYVYLDMGTNIGVQIRFVFKYVLININQEYLGSYLNQNIMSLPIKLKYFLSLTNILDLSMKGIYPR